MRPVSAPAGPRPRPDRSTDSGWRDRAAELFVEFEGPARSMVRRAFRGAFCDDELDDIYATAWVGTLRALESRHHELSDDQVRSYVFTAVAHQAGREIRRRGRKPTAPLELVESRADTGIGPEEAAADAESSRVTRDLLTSLPPRRRAVMLLRYGWGLEPDQVCGLVSGLSPRAYRKEITRGVDELTERVKTFERGEWCAEREPVLKAYVAGLADADGERQARAHLSHCRDCSDFVARLSRHLHDLGGALAAPGTIDSIDGHVSFADRAIAGWGRIRDAVSGGADSVEQAASSIATGGGLRGAGAGTSAGIGGVLGLGGTAKVVAGCLTGAAATAACVTAFVPGAGLTNLGGAEDDRKPVVERVETNANEQAKARPDPAILPSQVGNEIPPDATPAPNASAEEPPSAGQEPSPDPAPSAPAEPVPAEDTAQSDFSFGSGASAPATSSAPPTSPPPTSTSGSDGGGGDSGGGASSGGDFAFGSG